MARLSSRPRRDRWADWAVVGLLVVALLLGWAVMAAAQAQKEWHTVAHTSLSLPVPAGWLVGKAPGAAFRAENPNSGAFATAYELRVVPIDATAPLTPTLARALSNASLSRAQQGTAYRLFDVVQGPAVGGQPSMEASYVYVDAGRNLFVQEMPSVVLGLDIAVARGQQAYLFSLLADR